jgi:hypothetical protein
MAHTHTFSLTRVLALQTQGKLLSCSCLQPLFSLLLAGNLSLSLSLSLACSQATLARRKTTHSCSLAHTRARSTHDISLFTHTHHTPTQAYIQRRRAHATYDMRMLSPTKRYAQESGRLTSRSALQQRIFGQRPLGIRVSSSRLVSMSVVTDSACKCSSVTQISNSNPIVSQHIVTRLLAIGKPGLSVMGYGPRYIPMRISFFSPSRTNLHAIVHRPRVLSSTVLRDDFPHLVVQPAL